jgi:hypothetical protein
VAQVEPNYASPAPVASRRFDAYAAAIKRLPSRRRLTATDVLVPRFLLEREGDLAIYYAPVEWVRPTARLIAVGITPGTSTMASEPLRSALAAPESFRALEIAAWWDRSV